MEAIVTLFSGPLFLPSICLLVALAISAIAVVGLLHFGHGDVDLDVGGDGNFEWLGGATQWLNIRQIPASIWFCIFALVWWSVSLAAWLAIDRLYTSSPALWLSTLLTVRNLIIALPLTKLLTNPLRALATRTEHSSETLIGKECEISSGQAGPEFGQAKLHTDAAPLLLNIRTDGSYLAKGARVWITHYDERRRTYLVTAVDPMPPRLGPPGGPTETRA